MGHDLSSLLGEPMFAGVEEDYNGTQWIMNLGGSPFLYPVPAGFIAGKDGT